MTEKEPRVKIVKVITTPWHPLTPPCKSPEKEINYWNASDRKWLGNHCHWAILNGYSVTTYPI